MVSFLKLMDPKIIKIENSDSLFVDDNWLMEEKFSGRRIQCLIENNDIKFAGRYGDDTTEDIASFKLKFSRIHNNLKQLNLPQGTLLDGEVHLPLRSSSLTFQILNSGIDDAITLQEQNGYLVYSVFDVLYFENRSFIDKSLQFRKNKLKQIIQTFSNIQLVENTTDFTQKNKLWSEILNSDREEKGVVFKFLESEYESIKSKWWRKLKRQETYDAVITAFNLDNKYPSDFVSSITVAQYKDDKLVNVANVSGLTQGQAADFRSRIDFYIGKVIQFKAEVKTSKSYKNPRFDKLRFDKKPESCVW